jgi:hypothetical protein
MSRYEMLTQDSTDDIMGNTSQEVVEGESEAPDSTNEDDGSSDAASTPSRSTERRRKKNKNGSTNQVIFTVAPSHTTKRKSPPNATNPKNIPSSCLVGNPPHVAVKTPKNLLTYMDKHKKYKDYIDRQYMILHREHCQTIDEFNESMKLKTKSINQFQQVTERSNKASSDLGIAKVELSNAKQKLAEYKKEAKELNSQLVREKKKTKQLEERVNTSSQPIQEPMQVTLQKLKLAQLKEGQAAEKAKSDAAIEVDKNKALCQDQLHDNRVRRNAEAKEQERENLKNQKKGRHADLMARSSFGFVSIYVSYLSRLFFQYVRYL